MASSHGQDPSVADDELRPSQTEGYKVGEKKTVEEYAQMDANDESLQKWKASLGIGASGAGGGGDPSKPKLTLHSLSLVSTSAPNGQISINLEKPQSELEALKSNPITIKEGVDYHVSISFSVGQEMLLGLRYIHVVKRAGLKLDKMEEMIGSYGPRDEPYQRSFPQEQAPTGLLARSGNYSVRSRVVDDDGNVYADWSWAFKIGKEWA